MLLDATLANGGATLTREGFATEGVAVAGIAPAIRVDADGLTVELLADAVQVFRNATALGTWLHEGEFWIEPTEVFTDRAEAIRIGRDRGEIAVYDLGEGEEITL
ncbi:hypothetical protein [Cellulosimicrobium sp. TH-20]|uniref:hypothetical protein n=1 Tax=Cellulosimicrobium sp. TH-20 TaxID=1980001 RepID=UPI0011AB04D0|nr:hypothetical protein [Cellulosimicrobium sp. TH-20]